jgi:hypothetical protein
MSKLNSADVVFSSTVNHGLGQNVLAEGFVTAQFNWNVTLWNGQFLAGWADKIHRVEFWVNGRLMWKKEDTKAQDNLNNPYDILPVSGSPVISIPGSGEITYNWHIQTLPQYGNHFTDYWGAGSSSESSKSDEKTILPYHAPILEFTKLEFDKENKNQFYFSFNKTIALIEKNNGITSQSISLYDADGDKLQSFDYSESGVYGPTSDALDFSERYTIELYVVDKVTKTKKQYSLSQGAVAMFIRDEGDGVGLGTDDVKEKQLVVNPAWDLIYKGKELAAWGWNNEENYVWCEKSNCNILHANASSAPGETCDIRVGYQILPSGMISGLGYIKGGANNNSVILNRTDFRITIPTGYVAARGAVSGCHGDMVSDLNSEFGGQIYLSDDGFAKFSILMQPLTKTDTFQFMFTILAPLSPKNGELLDLNA